jgi:CheY-like chemotaxis protein
LISVDSEIGKGTTFTIELPAADPPLRDCEEPVPCCDSTALSILVIDDEPSVRETLADMVTALDHRVVVAESGLVGLELVARERFDIVFTDLAMPELDGWETASAVRRESPETLIVLVTGYGAGTTPPPGEIGLVDAVIGKPFDFDQVGEVISRLLTPAEKTETEPALVG